MKPIRIGVLIGKRRQQLLKVEMKNNGDIIFGIEPGRFHLENGKFDYINGQKISIHTTDKSSFLNTIKLTTNAKYREYTNVFMTSAVKKEKSSFVLFSKTFSSEKFKFPHKDNKIDFEIARYNASEFTFFMSVIISCKPVDIKNNLLTNSELELFQVSVGELFVVIIWGLMPRKSLAYSVVNMYSTRRNDIDNVCHLFPNVIKGRSIDVSILDAIFMSMGTISEQITGYNKNNKNDLQSTDDRYLDTEITMLYVKEMAKILERYSYRHEF